MGVRTGVKRVATGIGVVVLVAAMGACSTSSKGVASNVTLQQALNDYYNGNVSLAKAEFEQVTKEDPSNKFAWYNLGVIAGATANGSGTAGTDYQKALAIDPNFESALYNYGVLRFQAGDITQAISYLDKAVVANPKDANAHWNLGLALARPRTAADNKRSTSELNIALKLNPNLISSLGITPKPAGGTGGAAGGTGGTGTPTTKAPATATTKAATTTSPAP
jgi:Tfp pilus assembly protein PilF